MAASFAFLRDIRPYKTSWRVQVKVLHSWRQYTSMTGETLELVLVDAQVSLQNIMYLHVIFECHSNYMVSVYTRVSRFMH